MTLNGAALLTRIFFPIHQGDNDAQTGISRGYFLTKSFLSV
jgi:hypothetical protein